MNKWRECANDAQAEAAALDKLAEKIAARLAWDPEGSQFKCFKREALEVLLRNLPLLREVLK